MKAVVGISVGVATVAGWFLVAIVGANIVYSEMSKSNKAALARLMMPGPQDPDEFFGAGDDDAGE